MFFSKITSIILDPLNFNQSVMSCQKTCLNFDWAWIKSINQFREDFAFLQYWSFQSMNTGYLLFILGRFCSPWPSYSISAWYVQVFLFIFPALWFIAKLEFKKYLPHRWWWSLHEHVKWLAHRKWYNNCCLLSIICLLLLSWLSPRDLDLKFVK